MKTKITVSSILLCAIFFTTCEQPAYDPKSFFNNEAPVILPLTTQLQFDNIDIFPVTIYSDPAMSIKLVDVTASGSVTVDTEPAPDGMAFYPRYHLSVEGIAIPPYDGDSIVARVDEQQTTVVPIPPLESIDSADAFIKLENVSYFSLVMKKGTTEIRPTGENSAIVMSNETVGYSIPPGASSEYGVYKNGTTELSFPAELTEFNAGYVYSLRYDGTALVQSGAAKPIFPVRYIIKYDANGGSGQAPSPQVMIEGSLSSAAAGQNTLLRTGYTFAGWNTKADGTGTAYSVGALLTISANTTLYARWIPITYTVTYHANGAGGSLPSPQSAPYGSIITISGQGVLNFAGKVFGGWNTNANNMGTVYAAGSSILINENVTLYAQWVTNTTPYMVSYHANGGVGTVPLPQTAIFGTSVAVSGQGSLTYDGKAFIGWNTGVDGNGTTYCAGSSITISGDITLFAQWITVYTVNYNANGASGTVPVSKMINSGSSITVSGQGSLSYSGRTFAGWNTVIDGTGTSYSASSSLTVNTNITLYAQWMAKLTYNANGGSGTAPTAQTVRAGSTITLAGGGNLTRTGYSFGGWNTSSSGLGTAYAVGASFTVSEHVTLYAVWILIPMPDNLSLAASLTWIANNAVDGGAYTITVKANEAIAPTTLDYDGKNVSITLKGGANTITRNNTGSLFTVSSKVTLTLDNNVTLQGSANTVALVRVNSGGTLVMNNGSSIIGNKMNINPGYRGGGVYVTGGTFTMNGGEISGNTSYYGGGVYIDSNSTFTMSGGKISDNKSMFGGGMCSSSGGSNGTFTMSGGVISKNTSSDGGGIYVGCGTFTMIGGEISENKVSSWGGGMRISGCIFTMSGGKISGNTSDYGGGGVMFSGSGAFTMTGGEISGNTVYSSYSNGNTYGGYGGGIYAGGVFTKTGGTIYGSNASPATLKNTTTRGDDYGHAVYISDSPVKKRNTTAGAGVNLDRSTAANWE